MEVFLQLEAMHENVFYWVVVVDEYAHLQRFPASSRKKTLVVCPWFEVFLDSWQVRSIFRTCREPTPDAVVSLEPP
jgi:hypothetical protein